MTWYLVMVATGLYVGPIEQDRCMLAALGLASQGIVCAHSSKMMACMAPGHPGAETTCPVFNFPEIRAK